MEANDIMSAIEAEIKTRYPGEPVHWDRLPKDFKRPCFTLEFQKEDILDVNIGLVQRDVTFLVTCFADVDAYGNSSRADLNQRAGSVLNMFGQGFLRVGDRAPKVRATKGIGAPNFAEVSAVFSFTDNRPGYQDASTTPPEAGGAPRMEHFQINQMGKD